MRVLVLDDIAENALVLGSMIRDKLISFGVDESSIVVQKESDFSEAMRSCRSKVAVDVALVDIYWPSPGVQDESAQLRRGYELIKALRDHHPNSFVLAVTRLERKVTKVSANAQKNGADAFAVWTDLFGMGSTVFSALRQRVGGGGLSLGAPAEVLNLDFTGPRVFVVHGRDHALRDRVASFVANHGCRPVILDMRPNKGRTLIEKFEQEAVGSGFAVVLATSDDLAESHDGSELRARQNVIFELGWFCGRLGRQHVALIRDDSVVLPSDMSGFVWTSRGSWEAPLLAELVACGLVDATNI